MLKRFLTILFIVILIIGMCGSIYAVDLQTQLYIIQSAGEPEYLENDQGYISKEIVDSNKDTGEVTVNLSLSNITNNENEGDKYENTEVYIIVSQNLVHFTEDLNQYISYIDALANKVFAKNSNTKIGIIGMKGTIQDTSTGEDGNLIIGENDESDVKGTADNSEIIVNLTSDPEELKTGLQNMNKDKIEYRVNLQSAIQLANNSYSDSANKILISLYDGVPGIAIGVESSWSYGGWNSEYATAEEACKAKHADISSRTKAEILNLQNNNVDFILLRPDDTSYDEKWYSSSTGELVLDFDGSPYVQEIYGTIENPTYGQMYSLNNDSLEEIVTEYIYQDILEDIRVDIKSAVIEEYFSDDILNNFDITFSDSNIDTTNLSDSNYIVWNIGDVQANKTVNLQYTLKIKDMNNEDLLNKVISTSERTELTYVNNLDEEATAISTSSPTIQLSEKKEELTATVSYDPTTETTGTVTATIKTNKKVKPVEGWTLSEDELTLTKVFSTNTTETVHLVDLDNMTKDVVVTIDNIKSTNSNNNNNNSNAGDQTVATGKLPYAGTSISILLIILVVAIIVIVNYKKYNNYKDIK